MSIAPPGTCLEAFFLGLPVLAYGCCLQMYQRIAPFYALILHLLFTARYAWGDDDSTTFHDGSLPLASLTGVVGGFFIRKATQ